MNYNKYLHWFATGTACCTFLLLIAGGLVTSTGSGLAVPDWPLSYGSVMPPMVGGIFYEHGHRMIASFVGLLTIILTVWILRKEERSWMRKLAIAGLVAVVLQGGLGGLTVIFLLPTWISATHAALAQTFFCIVSAIALFTSRWWIADQSELPTRVATKSLLALSIATIGAVYLQLILGAVVRHMDAGIAVPDFPLAYGQLIPSLSPQSIAAYNEQLIRSDIRLAAEGPIERSQILIHMAHRLWAVVVAVIGVLLAVRLRKLATVSHRFSLFSYAIPSLLLVQITLGAYTILSRKAIEIATAHQSVGALLLVLTVLLALHVLRVAPLRLKESQISVTTQAIA